MRLRQTGALGKVPGSVGISNELGPKSSAELFINAYVPTDLHSFPDTATNNCRITKARARASMGRLRKVLDEEGLAENTMFVFMRDNGCHFMTRNQGYKGSTHNSSLRAPLLIDGPGFESARQIQEVLGIVNIGG